MKKIVLMVSIIIKIFLQEEIYAQTSGNVYFSKSSSFDLQGRTTDFAPCWNPSGVQQEVQHSYESSNGNVLGTASTETNPARYTYPSDTPNGIYTIYYVRRVINFFACSSGVYSSELVLRTEIKVHIIDDLRLNGRELPDFLCTTSNAIDLSDYVSFNSGVGFYINNSFITGSIFNVSEYDSEKYYDIKAERRYNNISPIVLPIGRIPILTDSLSISHPISEAFVCKQNRSTPNRNPISFTSKSDNVLVSYQWQWKDRFENWHDVRDDNAYEGSRTETLIISYLPVDQVDRRFYRQKISTHCSVAYSNTAEIKIYEGIRIDDSLIKGNVEICENDTVSFTASATTGYGNLYFKWEEATVGSTDFESINDTILYEGMMSEKLTIKKVTPDMDEKRYRCRIFDDCGNRFSEVYGTLYVSENTAVDIGEALTLCSGQGSYNLEEDIKPDTAKGNNFTWTVGDTVDYEGKRFNPNIGVGSYIISYDPPPAAKALPYCMIASTREITVLSISSNSNRPIFNSPRVKEGNIINGCVGDDPIVLTDLTTIPGGEWNFIRGSDLSFDSNAERAKFIFLSGSVGGSNILSYRVDIGGCIETFELTILVKENKGNAPVISGLSDTICPEDDVTLIASVKNPELGVYTYVWTDSVSSTFLSGNTRYSFVAKGDETLELRSVDLFGCKSVERDFVTIATPFSGGEIKVDKSVLNITDKVEFNYTGNFSGNTYKWDFGDGFFSFQQNPTHYYNRAGKFLINLKVTSTLGCSKVFDFDSVEVNGQIPDIITEISNDKTNTKDILSSIYPNPVNTLLTVEAHTLISGFKIMDMNGKEMMGGKVKDTDSIEINTSSLAKGSYIISLEFKEKIYQMKFIKE